MPSSVTAKIKLALERRSAVAFVLASACLLAVLLSASFNTRSLQVSGHIVRLEVAKTAAAQAKGLGGRQGIANDQGMLFVFSKEDVECFWMKDMRFPLDIIWLDGRQKVRYIEH